MKAVQWIPGKKVEGVLRIPASRVDQSATRGIIFDRPERHVVNTPYGQAELAAGDWVVTYPSGNRYAVKDADYVAKSPFREKWWQFHKPKLSSFIRAFTYNLAKKWWD